MTDLKLAMISISTTITASEADRLLGALKTIKGFKFEIISRIGVDGMEND